MPYVMRDEAGRIKAISAAAMEQAGWEHMDASSREYLEFLELAIAEQDKFRESDIHLARVLEDLIELLVEREIIRFTDFPAAAQKRLLDRQLLRKQAGGLKLIGDAPDIIV
jgi:hypothetical protein